LREFNTTAFTARLLEPAALFSNDFVMAENMAIILN
jgi:hypothetical protein